MKKGYTNNPNGRPKGKPNKITQDMRTWITSIIDQNRQQVTMDLQAIEPKERLIILEKLMQYVIPKQQATTSSIDLNLLSENQIDTIILELQNRINNED